MCYAARMDGFVRQMVATAGWIFLAALLLTPAVVWLMEQMD